MTNDTKKPGAEPGESQALLDEALSRLTGVENALESLTAKTSEGSDQASESFRILSETVGSMSVELKAVGELRAVIEAQGDAVAASTQAQVEMASSQSDLAKAIAQRDSMIAERLDRQDETIRLLADTLAQVVSGSADSASKFDQVVANTRAAHDLLAIISEGQLSAGTNIKSISDAIVLANQASTEDREWWKSSFEAVDGKLTTIGSDVSSSIRQISRLCRTTARIRRSTGRTERNVARILEVLEVVVHGIEAGQMYLAEIQHSLRSVGNTMLTTTMFFKTNKAMKADLLNAMSKLPEDLKRSVKEILLSAARIKHEAETFAASNKSQLDVLNAKVEQMMNFYSIEGEGVIELLKNASTQFNTKLSTEIGKSKLLIQDEVAQFLVISRSKLDGFAQQLKTSDFHKILEGMGAAYTNVQNLAKEISKSIVELNEAQAGVKGEIWDKLDLVQSTSIHLAKDIHNARTDIASTSKSLTTVREYLVDVQSGVNEYVQGIKDTHGIAQRILNSNENAQMAMFTQLMDDLAKLVAAEMVGPIRAIAEEFGLERLTDDLKSPHNTDE